MRKSFSARLNRIELANRFAFLGSIEPGERPVLDFGIGEDPLLVSPKLIRCLNRAASDKGNWSYAEGGDPRLLSAFGDYARKRYGVVLDDDCLTVSMGIKEALNTLAFLLVDPGDLVVATAPGYNVFQRKARLLGAEVRELKLAPPSYLPDLEAVKEEDWKRVKVLLLNYPNNPTGALADENFIDRVKDLSDRYGFTVINDGAYIDFQPGRSRPLSFLARSSDFNGLLELYSASKSFGLTGIRLGITAGDPELIALLKEYRDQENSGQFKPLSECYRTALTSVDVAKHAQKYCRRAAKLVPVLTALGFIDVEYRGAFYVLAHVPGPYPPTKVARRLLAQYGVKCIPYDSLGALRFSLTYRDRGDPQRLYRRLGGDGAELF